ncbi:MAG: response regulator transcription factor [Dehalococcoidia bacterium]|nr:response regulator transcription factor [Dehalococcoidia bacterium]
MRIAQIEDNPAVAEGVMLRFEVRWPDACVSHAQLGEHGMKMIGPENPDIVILGLEVSDMDGFDVCAQIRRSSAISIVVLTVRDTLEEIMKGSELGADDYMASPFKPVEFLARVSTVHSFGVSMWLMCNGLAWPFSRIMWLLILPGAEYVKTVSL